MKKIASFRLKSSSTGQIMALVVASSLLAMILYVKIFSFLYRQHKENQIQLDNSRILHLQILAAAKNGKSMKLQKRSTNESLVKIINSASSKAGIRLNRVQSVDNNHITIWVTKQSASNMWNTLYILLYEERLNVENFSVYENNEVLGLVDATLTISKE